MTSFISSRSLRPSGKLANGRRQSRLVRRCSASAQVEILSSSYSTTGERSLISCTTCWITRCCCLDTAAQQTRSLRKIWRASRMFWHLALGEAARATAQ